MSRSEQLADAFLLIARCDHYMIGLVEVVSPDEIEAAEQILITRQNAGKQSGAAYRRLDLALDLLEHTRRSVLHGESV